MNKASLIDYVANDVGVTKREAKIVVESVFNGVVDGLSTDGKVAMVGFGVFELSHRNARKARNPKTGEEVDVPAKLVPKFRASASLKEQFEGVEVVEDDELDEVVE